VVGVYGEDAFYLAVFDAVLSESNTDQATSRVSTAPVVLLALSLDAKIHVGHLAVVGAAPIPANVPLPAYKEAAGGPTNMFVVDFAGVERRPATELEVESLPFRTVVAPVRLEKALRAWHGLEPWLDAFDQLRADRIVTTAEVFR
jgi:hypothetical protein